MGRTHKAQPHPPGVAYFSMEIGLESAMPTYSGGLGVLAGDILRAAADLSIPMVGMTLLHRKGYFRQHLDAGGSQTESPAPWSPRAYLKALAPRVSVRIEGRPVQVRAWRYLVRGVSGFQVPVYLLDSALPENRSMDRLLTDCLYGGDDRYRLSQEAVLGLGGVAMLRALGYREFGTYHMNEGHAALLVLALLEEHTKRRGLHAATNADRKAVRRRCVFTTHTSVPAGHDRFPLDLVRRVLSPKLSAALVANRCCSRRTLDMTDLGMAFSRHVNAVSMLHAQVSRKLFPRYHITSVTNGVHAASWTSPAFQTLFDRYIPEWRHQPANLRHAVEIPLPAIRKAHEQAKRDLLAEVRRRTGRRLSPKLLTIGFARRATQYKRADLFFSDLQRLRRIARRAGPIQVIYGGKAHPRDEGGKTAIRRVFSASAALRGVIPVVYLEEYDMALARQICAGVDLWLSTPRKLLEASGTSGMKAALNGVPSLSVLDGWWIEGHVEGVTGWSIGRSSRPERSPAKESASLYDKLEAVIVPMYCQRPADFALVMRAAIALNGSFFNAQRMVLQYLKSLYEPEDPLGKGRRLTHP